MFNIVEYKSIVVPENRQRKEVKPEHIVELANSIAKNGLLHPPVIRQTENRYVLVAGECRMKAIDYLWNMGKTLRCGDETIPEGLLPVLRLSDLDPIDAYEVELEENIRRLDLSWQDRAAATAKLLELRQMQATRDGTPQPTVATLAEEIRGDSDGWYQEETRKELIVAKHLADPDVAKAKSTQDAFKVLKRKEELKQSAALAARIGPSFKANSPHTLVQSDCISWMQGYESGSFDVILTDPPYGMDAQEFGDSGGKANGAHFYDDSLQTWRILISKATEQMYRIAKPEAHAYLFCDIDRFHDLKDYMQSWGWKVFRTPLIWHNPTANRAPWPEHGPHRKWQAILYAIKGEKKVNKLFPDVLVYPSDENLNHQAQKPVALYRDLLARSCRPGDTVLDPFCGTGPIFPAAHGLMVKATGIEQNPAAAGIAAKRLEELK